MQVPILTGIAGSGQAEFRVSHPRNLEPIVVDSKISKGQLRAPAGAVRIGTGPAPDRGGILWNGVCYRLMGSMLVAVANDGSVTEIGDLGTDSGTVRFDYSFDRLGIQNGTALWCYDGANLTQVTDEDLGSVVDMMWIDGYWMTTDGNYIIVTELSDPTQIEPQKYGSAEEDPDMVTGLMKLRDEPYVLGRHTIQVFRNVGGNGFPFAPVQGATIPFGCVSATAKCYFAGTFVFVGGARNEGLRIYAAGQGTADPISTRAVEDALAAEADPTAIQLEARIWRGEQRLLVHLSRETWVYCAEASVELGQRIWYGAGSGKNDPYRPRHAVNAYGKWIVGDYASDAIGVLSDDVSSHFGEAAEWSFDAGMIYNAGKGGIVHSVELVGLPGRVPSGERGGVFLSMTRDGETFSTEREISLGAAGQRDIRLQWRPHARFGNYIGFRFRGHDTAMPGFARCEAEIEALAA